MRLLRRTILDDIVGGINRPAQGANMDNLLDQIIYQAKVDQVALLWQLLHHDDVLRYKGQPIKVLKRDLSSPKSFYIELENSTLFDTPIVSPDTIDDFTVLPVDLYKAPGYDVLKNLISDIGEIKSDVNRKIKIQKYHRWFAKLIAYPKESKNIIQQINEALAAHDCIVGGATYLMQSRYKKERNKNFTRMGIGAGIAAGILSLLLSMQPASSGGSGGNSVTREGRPIPDGVNPENLPWNPDGAPVPSPDEQADSGNTPDELKDLQKKHLGKGERSPPTRMEDILDLYLALTQDLPVIPQKRTDSDPNFGKYFNPIRGLDYGLSPEGVELQIPDLDSSERSLCLVLDITGSMGDPADIIRTGIPSTGYLLAVQLIKSYSDMGVPMRIIRYPIGAGNDHDIFETTGRKAALQELLYRGAGADDGDAVERLGTFYITKANNNNWESTDVVFITDAGPTTYSAREFMELSRRLRRESSESIEDTIHWANQSQIYEGTGFKAMIEGLDPQAKRFYYSIPDWGNKLDNVVGVMEVARKILVRYQK